MKLSLKRSLKYDLDFFPSSLLQRAQEILGNQFTNLPKRYQTGYTKVFWNYYAVSGKSRHKNDKGSFAMGAQEVKSHFTDAKYFLMINNNGYYLTPFRTRHGVCHGKYKLTQEKEKDSVYYPPTEWVIKTIKSSPKLRHFNGYQLSEQIIELMNDWYKKDKDKDIDKHGLVNHKGQSIYEVVQENGGSIFRDKSSTSIQVNINVDVKININSLLQHKKSLESVFQYLKNHNIDSVTKDSNEWMTINHIINNNDNNHIEKNSSATPGRLGQEKVKTNYISPLKSLLSKDIKTESIEHRINEINRLIVTARECGDSIVPVTYYEANTGRYFASNGTLQGYRKSVRYAALSGCYEYDIEAAHQNILLQVLKRMGVDFPELIVMKDYVANKSQTRKQLAKDLQTDIIIVKHIINAVTYGGTLCKHKEHCQLPEICNHDKALIQRVVNHKWFKAFALVFDRAHKHLVGKNKKIINAVGIESETKKKGADMAHILQGYERQILDAIIKHSDRDSVALLVHDCVVFYERQSTSNLSEIVKKETGFKLEFSEDKYINE